MAASPEELLASVKPHLSGKTVLVAEDQKPFRDLIAMIYTKAGATVTKAKDGQEAVGIVKDAYGRGESFSLVVLDLMMPRMNGLDALQKIRNSPVLFQTPVIIMTAVKDQRVRKECARLEVSSYLIKPPTLEKLLAASLQALQSAKKAEPDESPETPLPAEAASVEAPAGTSHDSGETAAEKPDPEPAVPAEASEPKAEEPAPAPAAPEAWPDFPVEFGGFPRDKSYALRPGYYRCPIDGTTFTAPRLVNRALKAADDDVFGLGLYDKKMEKDFLHYLLIEPVACPTCLYASDKTGFYRYKKVGKMDYAQMAAIPTEEWEAVFFSPNIRVQEEVAGQKSERLALARAAADDGFSLFRLAETHPAVPRELKDALVAYKLSALTIRHLLPHFTEEVEARLKQKLAGFLLKRAHVLHMLAKTMPGKDLEKKVERKRVFAMQEALETLQEISDVEFRVLPERLYCLSRRFHLADYLIEQAEDDEAEQKMTFQRKRALADMRALRMSIRNGEEEEGETRRSADQRVRDLNALERFLEPLEARLYEAEKQKA